MPVAASRTGPNVTVTITYSIAPLIAKDLTPADLRRQAMEMARTELDRAITAYNTPDAEMTAREEKLAAEHVSIKAARPTGTLLS